MKSGAPGKSEVTVMLQLASRQTLLLSGLLDEALLDDKEEK